MIDWRFSGRLSSMIQRLRLMILLGISVTSIIPPFTLWGILSNILYNKIAHMESTTHFIQMPIFCK